MQKTLRNERTKIQPLHGSDGIVYTEEEKFEAFTDIMELNCREENHPSEDDDYIENVEITIRRVDQIEYMEIWYHPDQNNPKKFKKSLTHPKLRG